MAPTSYRYELRRGDAITATGHITYETPLEVGADVRIGSSRGVVREIGPRLPEGEFRLVVQLGTDEPAESPASRTG